MTLQLIAFVCFTVLLAGCELDSSDSIVLDETGTWRGAIHQPRAIEELPSGEWVVLDRTDRVQIFSATGEFKRGWRTPETGRGNPRGLALDRHDNILVADTHYGQVLRYSPEGELLQVIGQPGTEPGSFCLVTGIVEDASGFLYTIEYGDRNRMQKFDSEGAFVKEWGSVGEGPGQFQRAQGIDLLPSGELVIADSVNHRLQLFSRDGEFLDTIGEFGAGPGQLNYPYDVDHDLRGRIYVIEFGNHRVQVFNGDGESLLTLGEAGRGKNQFHQPWGVTVLRSGEVLVADTYNHRIHNLGVLME